MGEPEAPGDARGEGVPLETPGDERSGVSWQYKSALLLKGGGKKKTLKLKSILVNLPKNQQKQYIYKITAVFFFFNIFENNTIKKISNNAYQNQDVDKFSLNI